MPLIKSSSDKARQENIKIEIDAGKDPKQAVAIGYAMQRRMKKMNGGEDVETKEIENVKKDK